MVNNRDINFNTMIGHHLRSKMAAKSRHKKSEVKIQHCPISSKFDMWVDNDVPNLFPTLKIFYRSPFSKWPPQYSTNSTLSDFNDIS